ncbi:unnamed protein product, partial [Staurois parvus]
LLLRKFDGGCSNFAKQTILRHVKHWLWQRFNHRSTVLQIQHSWSNVKLRKPDFLKKVACESLPQLMGARRWSAWQKSHTERQPPSSFASHRQGIPCGDSTLWKNKRVKRRATHQLCWKRGTRRMRRRRAHPLRLTYQQGCFQWRRRRRRRRRPCLHGRLFCRRLPHFQLTVSVLDVLAYSLCALCNFDACNVFCSILLFM